MPSISGASRYDRAAAGPVDEHLAGRPDELLAPTRAVIAVLQLGALARGARVQVGPGTCSPRPAASVPSSGEKVKKPAQSSSASSRNLEQLVVVLLGLSRVAEDERRPEGRARLELADMADPLEETGGAPVAAHPAQQAARRRAAGRGRSRARRSRAIGLDESSLSEDG